MSEEMGNLNNRLEIPDLLDLLAGGLRYTHLRINNNTAKTIEAASFLYALIEILNEKGIISIAELDTRQEQVVKRLVKKFTQSGIGLLYQDTEEDKYAFSHEVQADCEERLTICKAVCCKFPFALSKQDVNEGIIRWEFAKPYLIAHGKDGYCIHIDRETFRCTVYENRPLPCRGFNCQDNEKWRVWLDYEAKILNTRLVAETEEKLKEIYTPHNE